MSFLTKICKSISLLFRAIRAILGEILAYLTNPYLGLVVLREVSKVNRELKILWIRRRGRKPLDPQLRALIIEMKRLNIRWGAQRISDELRKIGLSVSKRTVLKIFRKEGLIIPPPHRNMKWGHFLKNHDLCIGIDFTCVLDLFGSQYFIFVILDLKSRALLCINVTGHPTCEWVVQQFRNAFMDFDSDGGICIADRDGIFGTWLKPLLKSYFEMDLIRIPYHRPWYNGKVERFHRSLKEEALIDIVPITLGQIRTICWQYKAYYNEHRCHQGMSGKVPKRLTVPKTSNFSYSKCSHLNGKIVSFEPLPAAA